VKFSILLDDNLIPVLIFRFRHCIYWLRR